MSLSDQRRDERILIVDDDPILCSIMRSSLEGAGFVVAEAGDGVEACRLCDAEVPTLVVVDAMMPRMDGFQLCRELRGRAATEHVPILMATGLDDTSSIERAYEAGATDFISKPLNWLILNHRVRYMLRAARAFEELRQNQERLTAARDAAEAASRAKSEFLANMSHELRTPLNAIIGFGSIMRDGLSGPLGEDYQEYATTICDSGAHLLAVINDILDIAQAETGGLELAEEPVEIGALAALCMRTIQDPADQAQVACTIETEPGLPVVLADPAKLRRILTNLLSNAVKFTPPGGRVRLSAVGAASGGVLLRVEDSGIGIPPEKLTTALSPFGQVDSGPSRRHDGVGLGLPLARKLVELHEGTLGIVSKPGEGTIVTVHIPERRCRRDGDPAGSDPTCAEPARSDPARPPPASSPASRAQSCGASRAASSKPPALSGFGT